MIVLLSLAAAGCISSEAWELAGRGPRRRESEEPAQPVPAERTGNVTVMVENISVGQQDRVHLDAAWRYADEHVVAAGGRLAGRNGIRVGVSTGGFKAALQAALSETRHKEVQRTSITALSGTRGWIRIGQDAYVDVLRYRTRRGEVVLLERATVGVSLVVEPTIMPGDMVHVKVYPSFTTREGREIDLAEMAVEVVVRHRQTMVIGSLDKSSDDIGSALFHWGRELESRQVTMTLTPFIQGAP